MAMLLGNLKNVSMTEQVVSRMSWTYLNALCIRRDLEEERTEAVREVGFRLVAILSRRH
jgi:hypothetical protein